MALWRVMIEGERRWARGPADDGPRQLLAERESLDAFLADGGPTVASVAASAAVDDVAADVPVLLPVDSQEVWAAGVTYLRSRDARMLESDAPDHYDRVYEADRPELFLKAPPGRAVGPEAAVGIRSDSTWDVPEAELGLVIDHTGAVVAYVIGNDMSSRSIEGENPLYLPQAKTYDGSCAVGPCLVPVQEAPPRRDMTVELRVSRQGTVCVEQSIGLAAMRRSPEDLARWLYRALSFPVGATLLTGTGIIPEPSFSLQSGDEVAISITGLGTLRNRVAVVRASGPEA